MHIPVMHETHASTLAFLCRARDFKAAWQMTQADYEQQVVAVAVESVMVRERLEMQPAGAADHQALQRLQALIAQKAPPAYGDPTAWAAAGVQRMLSQVFHDDVLVSELPGIAHVLLVKQAQMVDGIDMPELVRRTHMRLVEEALTDGYPVPPQVREEYLESMERMHVLSMTSQRPTLH